MLPGPDGCLDDTATENGEASYPGWNYRAPQGNPANQVVCAPQEPTYGGAVYAAHEVDQTILNPGDHWFWDASHPYCAALPGYHFAILSDMVIIYEIRVV